MNLYVADTHALFWYLTGSRRLGAGAKKAFDEGVRGAAIIFIPSIVFAELYFLNEKLGRPFDFAQGYQALAASAQFVFVPFEPGDVLEFDGDKSVPEMHDRIIVGVARRHKAACLTLDGQIAASGVITTVW